MYNLKIKFNFSEIVVILFFGHSFLITPTQLDRRIDHLNLKVQPNVSVFFQLDWSWSAIVLRHFGNESLILRKEGKPT